MENTIENNRLIAKFMGLVYNEQRVKQWEDENGWRYEELLYHSSWDWLIPVVKDIKLLVCESEFVYRFRGKLESFEIESVWFAVVEFIKWYNEQKNN